MDNSVLPYRVVDGKEVGDGRWYECHDILHGFGWCKLDEQGKWWHVWCRDIEAFQPQVYQDKRCDLTGTRFTQEELNELWCKLQPKIEAAMRRRRQWFRHHPPKFDRISIPKVNREYPKL